MSHEAGTSNDAWDAAPMAFLIGGLGLMSFGAAGCVRSWRLRQQGVSVPGLVIDIESDNENGGWPVVEFKARGKTHKFTSRCSVGLFSTLEVGASVPVRYSEATPANAVIDSVYGAFQGPISLLLMGLLCAVVALAQLLR